MKKLLLLTILGFSPIVGADEFIQMSNGKTCWKTNAGHIYGCSGGSSAGNADYFGAINPQTGQFLPKSGNGVINPKTGEYYPRSGSGFINPRTGEYYPGN